MQNMVWKMLLIVTVVGLCVLSLFTQDLSLGPDLRGGTSMVYQVRIDDDQDPQQVLTQMITSLKDRVNPSGVLAISMEPLGRDRIEIVMPLPNEEVLALREAYTDALDELIAQSEIRSSELETALAGGNAAEALGIEPTSQRGQAVVELQENWNALNDARAALAAAADAEGAELRALQVAVADAEIDYEKQRADVLDLSLSEARVRRMLAADREPQRLRNEDGTMQLDAAGAPVLGPSRHEVALETLRTQFADVAGPLDTMVEAYDAYQAKRTGFDDPEDLMRLLRGAGVLEFNIAVQASSAQADGIDIAKYRADLKEVGAAAASGLRAKWAPINRLDGWYDELNELAQLENDPELYFQSRYDLVAGTDESGAIFALLFTTPQKALMQDGGDSWQVTGASRSVDQLGRPAVDFQTDQPGAAKMAVLTGGNVGRPMAIVLDGEIFSAPTVRSTISGRGQITGNFDDAEITYLIRVLNAGSLSARLSPAPIAVNTLGPSLGQDNLRRGAEAFQYALIAVAVFMIIYYFFAGLVAVIALAANGVIIFGVMMGMDSTFTLPGLAGIVLTIGMAVDANVLIYERIREELMDEDADLRSAVREGYRKALSTILDGNITNLIVCLVLFKTATTEVKGFAVTLSIGILATLFTALFVTRQFYFFYTEVFKAKRLLMLPVAVPAIHRFLEPNVNWIGLRKIFWTFSIIVVVISISLVARQGVDMFDTELRGGVSMTMETRITGTDEDGEPTRLMIVQEDVQARIDAIGEKAAEELDALGENGAGRDRLLALRELRNASVLTTGASGSDESGAATSDAFVIKVANPKGLDDDTTIVNAVREAIVDEFATQLDVTQPLEFAGAGDTDSSTYVVPIEKDRLGDNIGRSDVQQNVRDFLGGAAVLLTDVRPAVTPEDLAARIAKQRSQQDYAQYSGRRVEVFGLRPVDRAKPELGHTEFAIVVFDEFRNYLTLEDPEIWYSDVADVEWELTSAALQRPPSLKQISTYSSAVAETLSAQAVVAVVLTLLGILVYIWARFGSLRYSVAAIVALVHDVSIALGLIAVTELVGPSVLGDLLLIEPFRIDLGVVAALLTIIGYSLNDTIVILDRVRENRGKRPLPTAAIVNRSINQTVSRTVLTSFTTLVAVLIMYLEGGSGMRSFTFCLLTGLIVGTYSSVAIAAPLVFSGDAPTAPEPTDLSDAVDPAPA